jgi:hypothetical protein
MEEWQQWVVEEREALVVKLVALERFLDCETFKGLPIDEQEHLEHQAHVMSAYVEVLQERIDNF